MRDFGDGVRDSVDFVVSMSLLRVELLARRTSAIDVSITRSSRTCLSNLYLCITLLGPLGRYICVRHRVMWIACLSFDRSTQDAANPIDQAQKSVR